MPLTFCFLTLVLTPLTTQPIKMMNSHDDITHQYLSHVVLCFNSCKTLAAILSLHKPAKYTTSHLKINFITFFFLEIQNYHIQIFTFHLVFFTRVFNTAKHLISTVPIPPKTHKFVLNFAISLLNTSRLILFPIVFLVY